MIRDGKQAKVTYAKHGNVISPVEAAVHTVQNAAVAQAKVSSALPQSVKSTKAIPGKPALCTGNRVPLKVAACKTVSEDITLQSLFSDKK